MVEQTPKIDALAFEDKAKKAATLFDRFFVIGVDQQSLVSQMDILLETRSSGDQEKILKHSCKSDLLGMYPTFSRQVKFDKANTDFVHTSCFPNKKLETKLDLKQPAPKALSALSLGDNAKYFI